jgi:hypothetical protein
VAAVHRREVERPVSRPSFGELGGQDPYDILELPSGASDADVRAARKRLLRRYHPDLPSGDLRRTQLITAAADLLLDPLRRIGYYDLRDEQSRRTVFARAEFRQPAPSPGRRPGPDGTPARPIRPTFITPSSRPAPAAPAPSSRPAPAASAPASAGPGASAPAPGGPGASASTPAGPGAASSWNALAVASVVAILTWTPLPLLLGLLALRQIRRFGQRGARLALTGVIAGAILVLVYVYVLVVSGF